MKALQVLTTYLAPLLIVLPRFMRQTMKTPLQLGGTRASDRENRWFPE
jgi:hypothetical protein